MSKGGGGGGSTQTVQKADPWKGVQPYLKDFYADQQRWADSSASRRPYYPGQMIANPFDNNFYRDGNSRYFNAMGGMMNTQRGQISPFQNITNNFRSDLLSGDQWNRINNYNNSYINKARALANGVSPDIDQYNNALEGQISAMRDSGNEQRQLALAEQQAQAAGAGALGNTRSVLAEAQTNQDAAKSMDAAEAGLRGDAWKPMLQAELQKGSIDSQNLNNVLNYGQQMSGQMADYLGNRDKTTTAMYGLAPGIYGMNQQNQLAPYQSALNLAQYQLGKGDAYTGYKQQLLTERANKYYYDPRAVQLNQRGAWLNGAGQLGGTTATSAGSSGNPLYGALSGGMAGYGLAGMTAPAWMGGEAGATIGAATGLGAWPMAIGGALLGGLS